MSRTADDREASSSATPLSNLYASIEMDLRGVEETLRGELRSDYPSVDELVRYGCLLGGKRLRPALLLLAAQAAGTIRPEHHVLGAVVEMIHTATLVHDDVLDHADMRRHLATVNARWDNETSVLLGDFLFTHAFYLASTVGSAEACQIIGRATNEVCEGELRQKGRRGDYGLTEAEYISIIEAKTSALCECSCDLGARFAGGSPQAVARLRAYGRNLGTAFQIADDLLDVVGDEQSTGKSLGTDFAQRIPTLPLIYVLEQLDPDRRAELRHWLDEAPSAAPHRLRPYFEEFDALEYTRRRAYEFAAAAVANLQEAEREQDPSRKARPNQEAFEVLRSLTEFVIARSM